MPLCDTFSSVLCCVIIFLSAVASRWVEALGCGSLSVISDAAGSQQACQSNAVTRELHLCAHRQAGSSMQIKQTCPPPTHISFSFSCLNCLLQRRRERGDGDMNYSPTHTQGRSCVYYASLDKVTRLCWGWISKAWKIIYKHLSSLTLKMEAFSQWHHLLHNSKWSTKSLTT